MQELQRSREGYKFIPFLFRKYEELPEDWEVMKLIDLCKNKPQYGAPVSAIAQVDGLPRYIRITDLNDDGSLRKDEQVSITDEQANSYILSEGEIVFARTGATVGKTYAYKKDDGKCAFAGYLIRFIPDENKLDTKFLLNYTHSYNYWRWLKSIFTEGVQPNVNAEQYSRMLIIKPPIKEQQKIASILSKVDELIQKTDQVIEQTQRLKKGLMQRLLTKGIGHTAFKETIAGTVPEKWNVMRLGDTLDLCQYGLSVELSIHGQYPIFRMNNIENGYMVANEMKFLDLDEQTFEKYRLEKGDLLFNRTNSSDLVGKIGIFLLDGEYTFASYLIRLRTKQGLLNPSFLDFYLNTSWMQYRLKSLATPGVSQTNINAANLKSIVIPVPPISEQEKIALILSDIDDRKQQENHEKEMLSKLKKGLMQKLLTGKIRVKV